MKHLYLSTTLPYVNADPHIGFALEVVQADIYARYRALQGDSVFFNTGTDEHGQKIYQRARDTGREPQEYVNEYATKFRELKGVLSLSENIHFVRTTDAGHKAAAQELWRRCAEKGDIYKKSYTGLYCVGDEMFLKEGDLVDGKCRNHPNMDPVEISEENYFFRLSAYQEQVVAYLSRPGVIIPEWRRDEALKFAQSGLEDFSISREKARMPWGVPVPGDDTQVMYVWFDALTNYISTLGWPSGADFTTYWEEGEVMQMAGKDQVRFQSIMWQAMLMSAGIKNTERIAYHGFITSGGQKMSKSLGNVIDPLSIVSEYGTDALRLFLARHVHPFEDSDVTVERFKDAYNADLANGIGNLAARVTTLAQANLDAPIARPEPEPFPREYTDALDTLDYKSAADYCMEVISQMDKEIAETKPFSVVKTDADKGKAMIAELAVRLYQAARLLQPFTPATSDAIKAAVLANRKPDNLFPRKA